jgi:HK97 gp10 family phage protein
MKFENLTQFAAYLDDLAAKQKNLQETVLEQAASTIEEEAKSYFGIYQPASGPYSPWLPLAISTIQDRVAKGYTPDDPLLRSGELRDSIKHEVATPTMAVVGSTSEIMVYQELGTDHIPPRPVLGPAAYNKREIVGAMISKVLLGHLMGKND